MVYDIQDYWVFGLCPSSGILEYKYYVSGQYSSSCLYFKTQSCLHFKTQRYGD
jgi:hypothetical protein